MAGPVAVGCRVAQVAVGAGVGDRVVDTRVGVVASRNDAKDGHDDKGDDADLLVELHFRIGLGLGLLGLCICLKLKVFSWLTC